MYHWREAQKKGLDLGVAGYCNKNIQPLSRDTNLFVWVYECRRNVKLQQAIYSNVLEVDISRYFVT